MLRDRSVEDNLKDCVHCGGCRCVGPSEIMNELYELEGENLDDIELFVCSQCGNVTSCPTVPNPRGLLSQRLHYLNSLKTQLRKLEGPYAM